MRSAIFVSGPDSMPVCVPSRPKPLSRSVHSGTTTELFASAARPLASCFLKEAGALVARQIGSASMDESQRAYASRGFRHSLALLFGGAIVVRQRWDC